MICMLRKSSHTQSLAGPIVIQEFFFEHCFFLPICHPPFHSHGWGSTLDPPTLLYPSRKKKPRFLGCVNSLGLRRDHATKETNVCGILHTCNIYSGKAVPDIPAQANRALL